MQVVNRESEFWIMILILETVSFHIFHNLHFQTLLQKSFDLPILKLVMISRAHCGRSKTDRDVTRLPHFYNS